MDALIRKDCLVCLESDVVHYGLALQFLKNGQKISINIGKEVTA